MSEQNWKSSGYRPDEHGWWKAVVEGGPDEFGYPRGYYFADTLRAIMVAFANFFKKIYVIRYDENGYPRKKIEVPLKFGPRAKSHDFRKEEESGETYVINLPNMYYRITTFQYDGARAASSNSIRTFYQEYLMKNGLEENEAQLLWQDTQPVPYSIGVELTARTNKLSDIFQILEQISSKFNPEAFVFIKEFWFMNIRRDIKMKLDSVSFDYPENLQEQETREIECKFNFTIEGQLYSSIESGSVIDEIIVKLTPSIAVHRPINVEFIINGENKEEKRFILPSSGGNWLTENGILEKFEDLQDGNSIYVPAKGTEDAFYPYDPPIRFDPFGNHLSEETTLWKFTSAYTELEGDRYRSLIGISGNYEPLPGSYDSATNSWEGSMTVRHDFEKLSEDDFTSSGRIEYLNSDQQKINTHWFSNHETEIRES